ncbi:TetR/AcrR family transcriptional regulator [Flavobacteriaceae bacterium D16]|nr:TetR/AcrR family transcriptional regulator [Flavobacteriaceae bacterium D16]
MPAKKKATKPGKDTIVKKYMEYVLEEGHVPSSVYAFTKAIKIDESDFYQHFGSLKGIQIGVWNAFFENTMHLLQKNDEFLEYGNREKMLSFFFTFFELLALNRSYVLFTLSEQSNMLKGLDQLKGLRKHMLDFAVELIDDGNADKQLRITQHNPKVFSEGAWLQTLFLLKFWMEDDSAGFEKTDMAIEKSVNTIFDVFDNTPLESIIDFGKFLFKENFA